MMLSFRFTLLLILVLHITFVSAVETTTSDIPTLPLAARVELLRSYSSLKQGAEVALGDLNGDGIADCATIFQYVANSTDQNRIAVLYGQKDGQFVLAVQSTPWEPHIRRLEYIGIEKTTITITASSVGYTDYSGTVYRFVVRDGHFTLAGLEYGEGEIGQEEKLGISANFLTNQIEKSRMVRGHRKTSRRSLNGKYRIDLQNFNLAEAVDAGELARRMDRAQPSRPE